jgi:hypothetical protein
VLWEVAEEDNETQPADRASLLLGSSGVVYTRPLPTRYRHCPRQYLDVEIRDCEPGEAGNEVRVRNYWGLSGISDF